MLSLGQRFRQQREHQKISLDAIAERTKINPRYLQAIETENFEDLPAGLFRRSFVRQYADALSLSDSNLEQELDELLGPPESGRDPARGEAQSDEDVVDVEPLAAPVAEPPGEHRMAWAVGLLVFTLVACSAIYALWERTQGVGVDVGIEPRQQIAEAHRLAPQALEPAPEPLSSDPPETTEPAVTAQRPVEKAQPDTPKPETPSVQKPPEAARLKDVLPDPAVPEPPPVPSPEELPKPTTDKIVVGITASEKVWVRMTADHQTVFRGMLGPQESKSFAGGKRTRILVGDAGAVEVIWNGKPIGPIGRRGQMRVIEFTPDNFLILSP